MDSSLSERFSSSGTIDEDAAADGNAEVPAAVVVVSGIVSLDNRVVVVNMDAAFAGMVEADTGLLLNYE